MHTFVNRIVKQFVKENLSVFPAVVILGPRQCGKSTLVKNMFDEFDSFQYLDLQNRDDLTKLREPGLFFKENESSTICLDEIQLVPDLFSVLRSEIDRNRRNSRFILLGSASRDIIQKSSESLAGRIGIIELTPFLISEIEHLENFTLSRFWYRGAFPDSFLANSDTASGLWCENYLRTFVERDIPNLGFQIPSRQIMRMLSMTAHLHGQIFNASKLGESLGLTHPTVKRYLDLLSQTFILRVLEPYSTNIKKRLIKSPKVYIRDSGLLHNLLGIRDFNALMGNPVFGASWEGLVIENICSSLRNCQFSFYRTATGDEIDLIIQKNNKTIAIECKASTAPKLSKGFWRAKEIVMPQMSYIVAPVNENYKIKDDVLVCNLSEIIEILSKELPK
ncbi:MAG: ATP-binding protein [Bacteroidales bacterium]|nr:ATP-binding protein [Bacteroidales bacterium]